MAASAFPGARAAADLEQALDGSEAAIVLTEWPEILGAAWEERIPLMREPRLIVDGRNCLDPDRLRWCGAIYRGIGRERPELMRPLPAESVVRPPRLGGSV